MQKLESFMTSRVQTKRVSEPASAQDGRRILVMSLWPRGVKKSRVDEWQRELGTPLELIRKWKSAKITWPELRKGYLASLKQPAQRKSLAALVGLARKECITLLCSCADESRCHRTLLKKVIEKALAE